MKPEFQISSLFLGGRVLWSLHTTMNLDFGFQAALMALQLSEQVPEVPPGAAPYQAALQLENRPHFAVFYDANTPRTIRHPVSHQIPLVNAERFSYPLTHPGQTFHAKLSLVCLQEEGRQDLSYRLAVYSKNAAYGSPGLLETGLLFALQFAPQPTESGGALQQFLCHIGSATNGSGRDWLASHDLTAEQTLYERLGQIQLQLVGTDRSATLLFGGCGGPALSTHMDFRHCDFDRSLILTPPEFIRGTGAEAFFAARPCLYDLPETDGRASHIKLYLLREKVSGKKTLYLGSANCTARGIGYDFSAEKSGGLESVECLVAFPLAQGQSEADDEFECLKSELKEIGYVPFDFKEDGAGSLQHHFDFWGSLLALHGAVTQVRYFGPENRVPEKFTRQTDLLRIEYHIRLDDEGLSMLSTAPPLSFSFRPAEYGRPYMADGGKIAACGARELVLAYALPAADAQAPSLFKFLPPQQLLTIGSSHALLLIPAGVLGDHPPLPAGAGGQGEDCYLSRAMGMEAEAAAAYLGACLGQMGGIHLPKLVAMQADLSALQSAFSKHAWAPRGAISAPSPAVSGPALLRLPDCNSAAAPTADRALPMRFQRAGSRRLAEIFQQSSRGFLADEAGLGKTFTATLTLTALAERQWAADGAGREKPFFALYIGPNTALLNKCCQDILRKYRDLANLRRARDPANALPDEMQYLCSAPEPKEILTRLLLGRVEALEALDAAQHRDSAGLSMADRDYLEPALCRALGQAEGEMAFREFMALAQTAKADGSRGNALIWLKKTLHVGSGWGRLRQRIVADIQAQKEAQRQKNAARRRQCCSEFLVAFERHYHRGFVAPALRSAWEDCPPEAALQWRLSTLLRQYRDAASVQQEELDRLVSARAHIHEAAAHGGRQIYLLSTSIHLMGNAPKGTRAEQAMLRGEPRSIAEARVLRNFGLVILDEYHRYFEKIGPMGSLQSVYEAEQQGLKLLFISATPYRANKSDLPPPEDAEDEEPLDQLPSFAAFAALFCGGTGSRCTPCQLVATEAAYKQALSAFLQHPETGTYLPPAEAAAAALQRLLVGRMVRHERTLLSATEQAEPHAMLLACTRGALGAALPLIQNQYAQQQLLTRAGYPVGALSWGQKLPWLLSFSTFYKYTHSALAADAPERGGYFQLLSPGAASAEPEEDLFLYGPDGQPKAAMLQRLPQQNLAFYQICQANLSGRMAQLIWMPTALPAYEVETGIFADYRAYSKLLVFGEYRYLQRGGALLLSEYANFSNGRSGLPTAPFCLHYAQRAAELAAPWPCGADAKLEDLCATLRGTYPDAKDALAALAAPAVCAARLGWDPLAVEESFNAYFERPPVKAALWAWMEENRARCCQNGQFDWELGLLRYCAEGNLYAVLREWMTAGPSCNGEALSELLCMEDSAVHVQTRVSYTLGGEDLQRTCGFAQRLSHDSGDVGTASGPAAEAAHALMQAAFNSPFYPMVLFVGRGAQEGLDFHSYCLRIMHLTLPRGAVSFDQRQGRIDRFRSLLVRRRVAEVFGMPLRAETDIWALLFRRLAEHQAQEDCPPCWKNDALFPNWQLKEYAGYVSVHHFQRLVPVLPYTEEEAEYRRVMRQLDSYRSGMGSAALELPPNRPGLCIRLAPTDCADGAEGQDR